MVGEGGPKFSFLTEIKTADAGFSAPSQSSELKKTMSERAFSPSGSSQPSFPQDRSLEEQQPNRVVAPHEPALFPPSSRESAPAIDSTPKKPPESMEMKARAPLAIQFGPTIQSFQELPVIVGKKHDCDFVINHAEIIDRHIQFSFYENNYWVKDLTGQGLITINDTPVQSQTPLQPGSRLSLGPRGPVFQFLNGGRLVEVADQSVSADSKASQDALIAPAHAAPQPSHGGKGRLILFAIILVILIVAITWVFINSDSRNGMLVGGLKEWWLRLGEFIQRIVG
jgi:hypothetical protein